MLTACLKLSILMCHHPYQTNHGNLRSGQKSDLVSCLETDSTSDFDEADVKLIDGASLIHSPRLDRSIKTFRSVTMLRR